MGPATLEITHFNQPLCSKNQTIGSQSIMLHDASEANAKLLQAKVSDPVVAAVLALGSKKRALILALTDSLCSGENTKEIARRYLLHNSTLSYWRRRLGLPKRQRGRRAMLEPTPEHQRILDLVHEHGITETARCVGVSKQRISQIVGRWAPQLRGRRPTLKIVASPRREHRPPRNIIISFRIKTDEWQRLLATPQMTVKPNSSGFAKARAIVLNHIVASCENTSDPNPSSISPTTTTTPIEEIKVSGYAV